MKTLFIALLCVGVGTGMFGQEDSLSLSKSVKSLEEDNPSGREGNFTFGVGGTYVKLKDDLLATNIYSGVGANVIMEGRWQRGKVLFSLPLESYVARLNLGGAQNFDNSINYDLKYYEFAVAIHGLVQIKQSTHYLGTLLDINLTMMSTVKQTEEIENADLSFDMYKSEFIFPAIGISYLYGTRISKFPINVNFALPLVYTRTGDNNAGKGMGTLSDYFEPTIKLNFFSKKKSDKNWWKITYIGAYTNTARGVGGYYKHRRFTNSLNFALGIGKKQ